MKPNREWFSRAKIGLFTHYAYGTYRPGSQGEAWGCTKRSRGDLTNVGSAEEAASALDAKAYAEAALDMGAQYVVFTVAHAGVNLLYPSDLMLAANCPEKCARTDAIRKLLDELEARGIPLVLYFPPKDNHDLTTDELARLGWDDRTEQYDEARERFNCDLMREIGGRYGGRIAGFWFDQGGPSRPEAVKEALLACNPDAVVFVNKGISACTVKEPMSDFVVSEYYRQFATDNSDEYPVYNSQINRCFGETWWADGGKARATAQAMFRYTVRTIAVEGAYNAGVNWAAGPYIDQTWEVGIRELMHEFGELVRARAFAIYGTVPGKSFVTKPGTPLFPCNWGVSTESPDGKKTYLHVLNGSGGYKMTFGPAADGKTFTRASANGVPLAFDPTNNAVTLPETCDEIDQVITLE